MSVINLKSVEETRLFKKLKKLESHQEYGNDAKKLSNNLIQICKVASDRMKLCPSFLSQFTLHDEVHLLRVTELMALIIPDEVQDKLNPVEIALLILAAFHHDQGMILNPEELASIEKNKDYIIFSENWSISHPNYQEIKHKLQDKELTTNERKEYCRIEQELNHAMLTDYIRLTHGMRGKDYITSEFSNSPLWEISGCNLAYHVAKISISHTELAKNITSQNKYYHDVSIGSYKVSTIFISVLLRLADILDFDRERTPDVLFKAISFTSKVSINEWEKHRAVEGWIIQPNHFRFTMEFDHPAYEVTARSFLDQIDFELTECSSLLRDVPNQFANYKIDFPLRVDRSRMGPKNESYIFYPMEFSLSRDEIVKLLMTDKLYRLPSLCVRELLQNSLDALRYRKAIVKRDTSTDWDSGCVTFKHYLDQEGYEILSCEDNGIGMDEAVITKFLTKVGHSYYRSPEYEYERISFRNSNVDFDPCSRFGIGFMSCFMIGDNITIETRKDYGPQKGFGKHLVVEINGLSGIIVIRNGKHNQLPGTLIKIKGRKKPKYFDEWIDNINLVEVLDGFALACEFPIKGFCNIEEIKDEISINPEISLLNTEIEESGCKNFRNYEVSFSDVNKNINGYIKVSVLLDTDKVCISNNEAKWIKTENESYVLQSENKAMIKNSFRQDDGQTCVDGILVCGQPGRKRECRKLGWWANSIQLHQKHDSFLVNFNGELKPELTPSRVPPDKVFFDRPKSWQRANFLANVAVGKLWAKILKSLHDEKQPELFWKLLIIHEFWPGHISAKEILEHMYIPLKSKDGIFNWCRIDDLNHFYFGEGINDDSIKFEDGSTISIPEELNEMRIKKKNNDLLWAMNFLLRSISHLTLKDQILIYRIDHTKQELIPMDSTLSKTPFGIVLYISFEECLKECISVFDTSVILNKNNELVKRAHLNKYNNLEGELDLYINTVVHFFSDKDNVEILSNKTISYVTRWSKILANRYKYINWEDKDSKFCPPYKIFIRDKGFFEITKDDLENWLSLPEVGK